MTIENEGIPVTATNPPAVIGVGSSERGSNIFIRTRNAVYSGVGLSVMAIEVTPINEAIRYSAYVGVLEATDNKLAGAAALSAANMVIEGGASLVGAKWLTDRRDRKALTEAAKQRDDDQSKDSKISTKLGKKIDKIVPKGHELPIESQAAVAYLGGSAVAQFVKLRQTPEITKEDLRSYGIKMSAAMSGIVGVQGYFGGEAFISPNPQTITVAAAVFVGGIIGANKIKGRSR